MNSESQPGANLIVPLDPDEPLPWAGPGEAVRRALRRVTPSGLAVRWAARPRRFAEDELREARLAMEAIVAHTPRAGEVEELAMAWLREQAVLEELLWRPWLLPKRRWTGTEHRDEALADGRGVIFSYLHRGPFHSVDGILGEETWRVVGITGDWMHDAPQDGLWARRVAIIRRSIIRSGAGMVRASESMPVVLRLLEKGTPVVMAFDMPGKHRMTWLGKPVEISNASARLAWRTGATIVPYWTEHEGASHTGRFGAPLRPEDFSSADELQAALGAAHEPAVLAAPEMMEDVRRPGAWEDGAGPDGWFRPQRGGST